MSDFRELNTQANDLQDISNKEQSVGYKTREISIGEVSSCDRYKNIYYVYLIDENVTIRAYLTGLLNDHLSKAVPKKGDLVIVLHKGTSDALILDTLDEKRTESWIKNKESSPFNNNLIMQAQSP